MKTLQQNSTHKAVLNGNKIEIWIKGATIGGVVIKREYLYSIPKENKDDLFAIFEDLDETNRIYLAEAEQEFSRIQK